METTSGIFGNLSNFMEPEKFDEYVKDCEKAYMEALINVYFQPERLNPEARKGCDSPNTPTKGSESSRND